MTDRFLMSSTRTVHTEACPTMRHVAGGQAARTRMHQELVREPIPVDVPLAEGEWAEAYRARVAEVPVIEVENLIVDRDDLLRSTAKYSRCLVCSPDVPAYSPPAIRTTPKRAGNLSAADLGRQSTLGRITRVLHTEQDTEVGFDDGMAVTFAPDEPLYLHRAPAAHATEVPA